MIPKNPFLLKGYLDKGHFCDREKETAALISAINNSRNVTLISLRRMGKTGLIQHVFAQLKKNYDCVYVDILPTASLSEFTFGKAVLNQLENPYGKSVNQLLGIFKKFTPSLSVDPMTGQPSFEINIKNERESESTLEDIFNYLKKRKQKAVIAASSRRSISRAPSNSVPRIITRLSNSKPRPA